MSLHRTYVSGPIPTLKNVNISSPSHQIMMKFDIWYLWSDWLCVLWEVVFLSDFLSTYVFFVCECAYVWVYILLYMRFMYMISFFYVWLWVCMSLSRCVCVSLFVYVFVSVYRSLSLSISVFVYVAVCVCGWPGVGGNPYIGHTEMCGLDHIRFLLEKLPKNLSWKIFV